MGEKLDVPVQVFTGARATMISTRQGAGGADLHARGASFANAMAAAGERVGTDTYQPTHISGADALVAAPPVVWNARAHWASTNGGSCADIESKDAASRLDPDGRTSIKGLLITGDAKLGQDDGSAAGDATSAANPVVLDLGRFPGVASDAMVPATASLSNPIPITSLSGQAQCRVDATFDFCLQSVSASPVQKAAAAQLAIDNPIAQLDLIGRDGLFSVVAQERHLACATTVSATMQGVSSCPPSPEEVDVSPDVAVTPNNLKEQFAQGGVKISVVASALPTSPTLLHRTEITTIARATRSANSLDLSEWALAPAPSVQAATTDPGVPGLAVAVTNQMLVAIDQASPATSTASTGPTTPDGILSPNRSPDAVHVLVVKLEPAELGTVTVRLSLKGETLSIAMSANEHGTRAILDSQRGALVEELKALGHRIGDISINLASILEPSATLRPGISDATSPSAQGNSNGSSGGGSRFGGQEQREPRQQTRVSPSDAEGSEAQSWRSTLPLRTGLYL